LFTLLLASCTNSEVNELYATCMDFKKPLDVKTLYQTYRNGELLEVTNEGNQIHFFSPHQDYNLIYSSFIVAEINKDKLVLSLKCAENKYAF
ncbi:MAG: hypothetical protein ABJ006_00815, partial [Balneola sp.]